MLSFFFFALGAVIGYWVRGTKVVTWINTQVDKLQD